MAAQFLSTELQRVRLRTPHVLWIGFSVDAGTTEIPIRIKAQSDDLPDDVHEVTLDYRVTVREAGN